MELSKDNLGFPSNGGKDSVTVNSGCEFEVEMKTGTCEKQLDIDLGLTVDNNNEVVIRRFITNDWPAILLIEILGLISQKVSDYYKK